MRTGASPGHDRTPGVRLVLASIAGFWLFFAAMMTVRSLLLNPWSLQLRLLELRLMLGGVSAVITLLLWLVLRRIDRQPLAWRIAGAAAGCGVAALVFALVGALVYLNEPPCNALASLAATRTMMAEPTCNAHLRLLVAEHLVTGYFLMATWAALYLALGYAGEVGAWERRSAALRAAAQASELRALRYQVNPHFLFNTLNGLSSLVMAGRGAAAEAMIGDLATYYRTSLAFDPERDVTLAEEIEMQRLYLSIEATRFPDRLRAVFDLNDGLADARVPGMLLQPLVENAVKHGVARSRECVTLHVTAQEEPGGRLRIHVADDAAPAAAAAPVAGTGTGLRNVADRLAARHGDAATLHWGVPGTGGFRVTIALPLVRDAD